MIPTERRRTLPQMHSLWRYIGEGLGHGSIQRVLFANRFEVRAASEFEDPKFLLWGWLGPVEEFFLNFVQVSGPNLQPFAGR